MMNCLGISRGLCELLEVNNPMLPDRVKHQRSLEMVNAIIIGFFHKTDEETFKKGVYAALEVYEQALRYPCMHGEKRELEKFDDALMELKAIKEEQ